MALLQKRPNNTYHYVQSCYKHMQNNAEYRLFYKALLQKRPSNTHHYVQSCYNHMQNNAEYRLFYGALLQKRPSNTHHYVQSCYKHMQNNHAKNHQNNCMTMSLIQKHHHTVLFMIHTVSR